MPLEQENLSAEQAKDYWDQLDREEGGSPVESDTTNEDAPDTSAASEGETEKREAPQAKEEVQKPENTPDPWVGVPEIVKTHLQSLNDQLKPLSNLSRLEQGLRETVGRVGAIQSELSKRQAEKPAAASADAPSPAQIQAAAASKDPEKWKRLKEDFPEWAEGVTEYLESRLSSLPKGGNTDELRTELATNRDALQKMEKVMAQSMEQIKDMAARSRSLANTAVELRHPGWQQVTKSKAFATWYAAQPREIHVLGDSEDPLDAIRVMDKYQEFAKAQPDPDRVKREREQRLSNAGTPRGSRSVPMAKRPEDMTDDEYWKFLEEQERANS